MSAKQKIVNGRGLSNLNVGIFVCSFDVCRASKPVPSINYVYTHVVIKKSKLVISCLWYAEHHKNINEGAYERVCQSIVLLSIKLSFCGIFDIVNIAATQAS